MKEKYLLHTLNEPEFDYIISVLECPGSLPELLSGLNLPVIEHGKILVDTAMCSEDNKNRFMSYVLNESGDVDLSSCEYVDVSDNNLDVANFIVENISNR